MKLLIKNVFYRLFIIMMLTIMLSLFVITSVSEAKFKLGDGQYYYTGTQEGSYVIEANFWEKALNALAEAANYLLGLFTFAPRGVAVGWIEIAELMLTAILNIDSNFVETISSAMSDYTNNVVTLEKIIFNEVEILDANIFKEISEN